MVIDTSFFVSPLSEGIREEGRAQGQARSILRLLDGRGVPLSEADRERIESCADLTVLDRWLDRAITATTADEVFAEDTSD
ncbi:hypothetical protein [Streptomyces acidiscabies]|uniref:hypothetical protein n=1 Tax=Streptomyces acidiscabies TaxID=42234 RepID=UPI0038F72747